MQVTREDIQFVAQLVDQLCGVMLDETKGYLVESRLGQLARDHGCTSYRELCQRARATGDRALQQKIIDAITTQETLFFRDNSPFDALQNRILPDLIDACTRSGGAAKLRFWSAACSTGQEPYSLAMILRESIPNLAAWNVSILATDISDAAIAQASRGWYAAHEIDRGMRASLLPKYFKSQQNGWQVKDEIRGMVSFQRRNLLQPFTEVGRVRRDLLPQRGDLLRRPPAARPLPSPRRSAHAPRCDRGRQFRVASGLGAAVLAQNHCRATYYQPNLKPAAPAPAIPAGGRVPPRIKIVPHRPAASFASFTRFSTVNP